jgi:hypothetical protein
MNELQTHSGLDDEVNHSRSLFRESSPVARLVVAVPHVKYIYLCIRTDADNLWGGVLGSLQEGTDKCTRPGANHGGKICTS